MSSTRQLAKPAWARPFKARAFESPEKNVTVAVSDSPCDAMDTSSGPDLNGFLCIQGNHEVSSQNSRHCFSNASVVKEPGGLMSEILWSETHVNTY